MKLLALDPGGKTGWALTTTDRVEWRQSGVWDLGRISDPGTRFLTLQDHLGDLRPDSMVIEDVWMRGSYAKRWHYGYRAVVQQWAAANDCELLFVAPKTLKIHATGYGGADKTAMLARAHRKFHFTAKIDDNRVDALWLLDWLIQQIKESE